MILRLAFIENSENHYRSHANQAILSAFATATAEFLRLYLHRFIGTGLLKKILQEKFFNHYRNKTA